VNERNFPGCWYKNNKQEVYFKNWRMAGECNSVVEFLPNMPMTLGFKSYHQRKKEKEGRKEKNFYGVRQ
jgi:hypothetical protein